MKLGEYLLILFADFVLHMHHAETMWDVAQRYVRLEDYLLR